MESLPSLQELVERGKKLFVSKIGSAPRCACSSPGRVNIIGEHVDYNGGLVLPMAMPMWTVIVGTKRDDTQCRIFTDAANISDNFFQFNLPQQGCSFQPIDADSKFRWANYVVGTIAQFSSFHCLSTGFDCVVISSVPIGGGLSSSASLEAAMFTFLESVYNVKVDPVPKALACQKAEHDFANVPCGIMDQFATVMCKEHYLLLLDCVSQQVSYLPFQFPQHCFLVINSGVKHQLGDGAYRKRREMCEHVASILGVSTLRDATLDQLNSSKDKLSKDHYNKALHVLKEIERTEHVKNILVEKRQPDEESLRLIGKLMRESHESLKVLYEVSCDEVDALVETCANHEGVLGARITGGGFGGCCVILLEKSTIDCLVDKLRTMYKEKFDRCAQFYLATPQGGCSDCSSLLDKMAEK